MTVIGRASLLAAALALHACDRGPPAPRAIATPIAQPRHTRERVWYPADRQPILTAPDGSRRRIASMLAVPKRMAFGDYVWNDRPGATGPVWVRVDLSRQLISVFRGADEIGAAVILYGTDGMDTPTGVFPVRGKERLHRSLHYDADMPFTLWLTGDGVAIHASSVVRGHATHGCIGTPLEFAGKLFDVVRRGDSVIVLPATAKNG